MSAVVIPHKSDTVNQHLQEFVHAAQQPHPGLTAGLLVNSAVFALGLKILLKGAQCC